VAARVLLGARTWIKVGVLAVALGTSVATATVAQRARSISPAQREVMALVEESVPATEPFFMYPEGDYLLWPREALWYLPGHDSERLLTARRADEAVAILKRNDLRVLVIKKHLIRFRPYAPASGYPPKFVDLLNSSSAFRKVFENSNFVVYEVSAAAADGGPPQPSRSPTTSP